jgi:hypothetical protein
MNLETLQKQYPSVFEDAKRIGIEREVLKRFAALIGNRAVEERNIEDR